MSDEPEPSPCIGACAIDAATGYCRGCRRTRDEIAAWRDLSDEEKRALKRRLAARPAASQGLPS